MRPVYYNPAFMVASTIARYSAFKKKDPKPERYIKLQKARQNFFYREYAIPSLDAGSDTGPIYRIKYDAAERRQRLAEEHALNPKRHSFFSPTIVNLREYAYEHNLTARMFQSLRSISVVGMVLAVVGLPIYLVTGSKIDEFSRVAQNVIGNMVCYAGSEIRFSNTDMGLPFSIDNFTSSKWIPSEPQVRFFDEVDFKTVGNAEVQVTVDRPFAPGEIMFFSVDATSTRYGLYTLTGAFQGVGAYVGLPPCKADPLSSRL